MIILYAILTFILTIILEILATLDIQTIEENKPIKSGVVSALLSLTAAGIVVIYIDCRWMILADVLGSFVGAYLSVRIYHATKSRLPEDPPPDISYLRHMPNWVLVLHNKLFGITIDRPK